MTVQPVTPYDASEAAALDLVAALGQYTTYAGGVWDAAVRLSPEECEQVLHEFIADAEAIRTARALFIEEAS